jgi:hypothetical protein
MTVVTDAMKEVSEAARSYESRWTLAALKLVDPGLFALFIEQQNQWGQSLVTGSRDDIREQTGGMIRGWVAITRRMEEAGAEPDAWVDGIDARSGLQVRICRQRAALDAVPEGVVAITPDEAAALLAAHRAVLEVKQLYPGAELIDVQSAEVSL